MAEFCGSSTPFERLHRHDAPKLIYESHLKNIKSIENILRQKPNLHEPRRCAWLERCWWCRKSGIKITRGGPGHSSTVLARRNENMYESLQISGLLRNTQIIQGHSADPFLVPGVLSVEEMPLQCTEHICHVSCETYFGSVLKGSTIAGGTGGNRNATSQRFIQKKATRQHIGEKFRNLSSAGTRSLGTARSTLSVCTSLPKCD